MEMLFLVTVAMVWVGFGMFIVSQMRASDKRTDENDAIPKEEKVFWLKNRADENLRVFLTILFAPAGILSGPLIALR